MSIISSLVIAAVIIWLGDRAPVLTRILGIILTLILVVFFGGLIFGDKIAKTHFDPMMIVMLCALLYMVYVFFRIHVVAGLLFVVAASFIIVAA